MHIETHSINGYEPSVMVCKQLGYIQDWIDIWYCSQKLFILKAKTHNPVNVLFLACTIFCEI